MWRQNSSCTRVTVSQTLWNSVSWQNQSFSVLASPFPGACWGCGVLVHISSPARPLQSSWGWCGDGAVLWGFVEGRTEVLGQAVPQESLDLWRVLRWHPAPWPTWERCRGVREFMSLPNRGASGTPDAGHSWSACSLHRHPRVNLILYFYSKYLLPAQSHPFQLLVPCSQRIQIACSSGPFSGTQTREETHARIWVCINSHSTLATQFPTNLI